MTTNNHIEHTSFVIERELAASSGHAFRFWSDAGLKARWTGCHPDWLVLEDTFDFRVGGTEAKRWRTSEGDEQTFRAHYFDIVPERRIIYGYEMSFAGKRLSISLVTVTFEMLGGNTKMAYTEQVAILTGGMAARDRRLIGTEEGLDRLVRIVERERSGVLKPMVASESRRRSH